MRKDLGSQLAKHSSFVLLRQFLEDGIHALALGISNGTQAIASHCASNSAGKVGHNEAHCTTAQAADNAPEFAGRRCLFALGHSFIAQHLLENVAKLLIVKFLLLFLAA